MRSGKSIHSNFVAVVPNVDVHLVSSHLIAVLVSPPCTAGGKNMKKIVVLLCSIAIFVAGTACLHADFNTIGNGLTGIADLQYGLNRSGNEASNDTVSFPVSADDQASLQTCAMNPISPDSVVMDIPPLPEFPDDYPIVTTSFTSSSSPTPERREYTPPRYDDDDPPPPNVVPEPATMLVIGLGLCGLVPLTRRNRKSDKS